MIKKQLYMVVEIKHSYPWEIEQNYKGIFSEFPEAWIHSKFLFGNSAWDTFCIRILETTGENIRRVAELGSDNSEYVEPEFVEFFPILDDDQIEK